MRFKFITGEKYLGCREEKVVEVPEEELEGLSKKERKKYIKNLIKNNN